MRKYINIVENTLTETPIANWDVDDNFDTNANDVEGNGYRHWSNVDKATIKEPARIERVKKVFSKCPFKFNILFYHLPFDGREPPKGNDPEYYLDRNNSGTLYQGKGVLNQRKMERLPEDLVSSIEKIQEPDAINFILTNNISDEAVSLASGWILAHRIGHALDVEYDVLNPAIKSISFDTAKFYRFPPLSPGVSGFLRDFCAKIGTMRSARTKTFLNTDEFCIDLIAQYIVSGSVKFNDAPESLISTDGKYIAQLVDVEEANKVLKQAEQDINTMCHELLERAVGKVLMD